jgi:hypothetical protein
MFSCKYEGNEIEIELSKHAEKRINERGMSKSAIYASITAGLDFILDLKPGTEFVIIDKDCESSTVASVYCDSQSVVSIDVITVVDNTDVFVKNGTNIIRLGNVTFHDGNKKEKTLLFIFINLYYLRCSKLITMNLEKEDLIHLIMGTKPKSMEGCQKLVRRGVMDFTGNQWNPDWEWNRYLRDLSEEELHELYLSIK